MVDIYVDGLMELNPNKQPIQIRKCRKYIILHYEEEIVICILSNNQLVFDNRIRLTGPIKLLLPHESSTNLFIILKNVLLYQYNLETKYQRYHYSSQFDKAIQIDDFQLINTETTGGDTQVIFSNIKEVNQQVICLKNTSSEMAIFKQVGQYCVFSSISQFNDKQQLNILVFLIDIQKRQLLNTLELPNNDSLLDICLINNKVVIILQKSAYLLTDQLEINENGIVSLKNFLPIKQFYNQQQNVCYLVNANDQVVKLKLNMQKQLELVNIENYKTKNILFRLNKSNQYFNLSKSQICDDINLLFNNQNSQMQQIERIIQTKCTNKIILDYIKTIQHTDVTKPMQMNPLVIMYDVEQGQLELMDIIHFKQIRIKTPPISQFCMACTMGLFLFSHSVYNQDSNLSTIQIHTITDFVAVQFMYQFEVWGNVKCITLQHDTLTVCTVVTFENSIFVQRIESREEYSFQCEFPVKSGFELSQPFNLYVMDENNNGHFITVPTTYNPVFSHTVQISNTVYNAFDYMLVMYTTQWKLDNYRKDPILLPKNEDIEIQCFTHNMALALDIPMQDAEQINSLEQQMRPTFQINEISNLKMSQRPSVIFKNVNQQYKQNNLQLKVYNYYDSHSTCFEVNINNLLQRLQIYVDEIQMKHQQNQDDTSEDSEPKFSSLSQANSFDSNQLSSTQISSFQFEKSALISPQTIENEEKCMLERASVDMSKKQIAKMYQMIQQRFSQKTFESFRQQFSKYNELETITHSVFQTLNYTKFQKSQVFSYNFLNMYLQYKQIDVNKEAEFVLYDIVSRIVPLFSEIISQQQNEQQLQTFRNLLKKIFNCDNNFNFNQFSTAFDIEQQCHSGQKSYMFTIGFLCLFTLFASINCFKQFKGYSCSFNTFEILEDALLIYLQNNAQFLCLHSIVQFLNESHNFIRYSCLTLLRLYQKNMGIIYWGDQNQDQSNDITKFQNMTEINCIQSYLVQINKDLLQIVNVVSGQKKNINAVPSNVAVIEMLSKPIYYLICQITDFKQVQQSVLNTLQESVKIFIDAVKTLETLTDGVKESDIDVWQNQQLSIVSHISMYMHSVSYNIFCINAIFLFQADSQKIIDNPNYDVRNEVKISPKTVDLIKLLLKLSQLLQIKSLRIFMYEQVTQLLLKQSNDTLFIDIIKQLIEHYQYQICYKSLQDYFEYLKYNYIDFVQHYSVQLMEIILPVASQLFKQFLHNKSIKPLLTQLLKIVQKICTSSDLVNHFTKDVQQQQQQYLMYGFNNYIKLFNFRDYSLSNYSISGCDSGQLHIDLVKACKTQNYRNSVVMSQRNRFLMVNKDVFDESAYLMLPLIFGQRDVRPIKEFPFQVVFLNNKEFQIDQFQNLFVIIEGSAHILTIIISSIQKPSEIIFKIPVMGQNNTSNLQYGLYKMKKTAIEKSKFGKKPQDVIIQVDEDQVMYTIMW